MWRKLLIARKIRILFKIVTELTAIVSPGVCGNVRAGMGRKEIICSWKKSINSIKDVFDFLGKMGS